MMGNWEIGESAENGSGNWIGGLFETWSDHRN